MSLAVDQVTTLAAAFAWGQWRADDERELAQPEKVLLGELDRLARRLAEAARNDPKFVAACDEVLKLGS
jgi:hypothetical protein